MSQMAYCTAIFGAVFGAGSGSSSGDFPEVGALIRSDKSSTGGVDAMADVKSDIEIARAATKKNIMEIGAKLNIPAEHLLPYGHDKAKISAEFIAAQQGKKNGKLILVTAINPTPAGEGKTTTTVGLGD
eukprot:gene11678-15596_t